MKFKSNSSVERFIDLITGVPLTGSSEVIDLGVLPIPGLFFPTPILAGNATSRVRVIRSKSSGLIQLDRDINPIFYNYYKSGRVNAAHLSHIENTADKIAKEHDVNAVVLEIGGGAGHLMRALVRRGFRNLFVIDPSGENRDGQGYKVIHDLFPGGLEQMSVRFDLIIGQHFLEHSSDPVAVLKAAGFLLRENGVIWIEVPDIQASAKSENGEWLSVIYALHSTYFDLTTLRLAGLYSGLDMIASEALDHYGKSIVGVFKKRENAFEVGKERSFRAPEPNFEIHEGIRKYFSQLSIFGKNLPPGLLCWGAAERCLTVLGACIAGGFSPGRIIDSNPDLRGLYISAMKDPILAPEDISGKIDALLILSLRNAETIVRSNASLFTPDADVYIPFVGVRKVGQLLNP
jgi:SAM-dependent methyltransferase